MKVILLNISILLSLLSFSQNGNKEFTVGVTAHTRSGFIGGFQAKYSKRINKVWSNHYAFEMANIRDPKEIRIPTQYSGTFILGKSNFLFSFRPQYGVERLLFAKDPDQGIKVSIGLTGGPTLGIVKPYMVEFENADESTSKAQYTEDIDLSSIVGNAGWFNGVGKSKIVPGAHLKLSLVFEYSTIKNRVSAIETGFMYEQLVSKIELNPFIEKESSFLMAFVTLSFGKKL